MEDLSGLDWTSSTSQPTQKKPPMNHGSYYPPLRPTPPISGRSSPFTAPHPKAQTPGVPRSSASTPANDSFANLVSFNGANQGKGLSLQEQQKRLQEEKLGTAQKNNTSQSQRQDEDFWEQLGSGRSTPNPITSPMVHTAVQGQLDHQALKTMDPTNFGNGEVQSTSSLQASSGTFDDDDPFDLGSMAQKSQQSAIASKETTDTDDDILGMLGRPVSEFAPPTDQAQPSEKSQRAPKASVQDQALAELMDMGFPIEKSRHALEATDSGADVQSAVGWLLNQAHKDSRSQSRGAQGTGNQERKLPRRSPPRTRSPSNNSAQPAWMRDSTGVGASQRRQDSKSPVNGEKDPAKVAAELGNNLFKTANSLWKTGTKKLNQAVADFNSDSDSSQPKWMRDPSADSDTPRRPSASNRGVNGDVARAKAQKPARSQADPGVTDEALMLESADARPPRKPSRPKPEQDLNLPPPQSIPNERQDAFQRRLVQQPRSQDLQGPRGRLSKQAVEEQMAEAYISPARRKRTTPKPADPEPDLLFGGSVPQPDVATAPTVHKSASVPPPRHAVKSAPTKPQTTSPAPTSRPARPKRTIPPVTPTALKSSHSSRQAGTSAFKRGDYAEATSHYTSATSPLPPTHPLHIVILTNRALSNLKTGDPKACVADTTAAIELIGPSRGASEVVDLGNEGVKGMSVYWGKAMTRQAEALEQLERWADAGVVWKACVEAGVGGATSIAGRNRCDRVVKGPSASTRPVPKKSVSQPVKARVSALDDLSGNATSVSENKGEAVERLRAANVAADALDDEKFALADTVSARIANWRSGKEGNLRALLASLDQVLWDGSGWKKVGMGELLTNGKVKLVYMKAVGRSHPDKLPTTATTEQRMIAAAVFATLNQAWDGFKQENGM
ncbi:MAG: hypothetical protein Q9174_001645 [Haloplaca sp. 1 TL-2023]